MVGSWFQVQFGSVVYFVKKEFEWVAGVWP